MPDMFDPYEPSMGLFLRNDLHKVYDCYEWSLYHKVGQLPNLGNGKSAAAAS